jgi:hypothetical protein
MPWTKWGGPPATPELGEGVVGADDLDRRGKGVVVTAGGAEEHERGERCERGEHSTAEAVAWHG